jgi:hypothetical protein
MTTMIRVACALTVLVSVTACVEADDPETETVENAISWGDLPPPGPTTIHTPIGLAISIDNGVAEPLEVRKRQTFYINQIDLRAAITSTVDEGVAGLAAAGDFAGLDWHGTELVDQSFVELPNADGTFTRRRMYRDARWMDWPSFFLVEQLDAHGHRRGVPIIVDTGLAEHRTPFDSFFARRLRGIQWTFDCASKADCAGATAFEEEALVELRYAGGPRPSFQLHAATTQLRVTWTANQFKRYTIPVTQIAAPEWDYGLGIDLAMVTPARPDGTYAPGQPIQVRFTLRDGSGKRLHAPGTMPTYLDYLSGDVASGLDYWNASERVMTYYRRKHRERQMLVAIDGPVDRTGPVRDTLDFFGQIVTTTDGALVTATPAANGFFGAAVSVPAWQTVAGITPLDTPVSDLVTFTLPADAPPGTYKIVMKARRSYLGEDLPRAQVRSIQVGTPEPTTKTFETGRCTSCHDGDSDLVRMGHGLAVTQRDTCTTCHVPLPFEPEGTVYVRTHFIHSRSGRLNVSPKNCSVCHLTQDSIERVSKSACLSCHTTYPSDHVAAFGPVVDMYIGGTIDDSFEQCTTACHANHPSSGL